MKRFLFAGCFWGVFAGFATGAEAQKSIQVKITKWPPATVKAEPSLPGTTPGSGPLSPATLRWNNGESLTGQVDGADDASLAWSTPFFNDPLSLAWSALHRVDQAGTDRLPTEPFACTLRDGSRLYGDLTGLSADTATLQSDMHGLVTLRRAELLDVRRIRSRRLVFSGPAGAAGWTAADAGSGNRPGRGSNVSSTETLGKVPTVLTGSGGALALPFFDRTAFLKLPLPERVDAEFRVSATERPEFSLALDGAKGRLRVETWGDQLVLTAGDGFTLIRTLGTTDHDVALRVCWDTATRACQVYTPGGLLLQQWAAPEEKAGKDAGVTLHNQGRSLVLDVLRVREWDGQRLGAVDRRQPGVLLDDGSAVAGLASGLEGGELVIPAAGEGLPMRVPLAEVDTLRFADAAPATDTDGTTLSGADGTFLRGRITGAKDGSLALQTRFADAPLPTKLTGLRRLFIRVPAPAGAPAEPPLFTRDKLVLDNLTLHGKLVATGDAEPHWLPVGGTRAATPSHTLPSEIVRAVAPGQETPGDTSLFYTRAGDAIPGKLHGMDRQEIEFESPIIAATSLPTGDVEAVQFDVSSGGSVHGFDAPGWQAIKGPGAEMLQGDKLHLPDGSMAGYPSAMGNGEVRFTYDTANFSVLRLRLFCDLSDPNKGTNYLLFRSGNSMSTGIEPENGRFSNQNRLVLKDNTPVVRLVIDEKNIRCYLDDLLADTVPLPAAKRAGSGLILEPTSLWGNAVEPVTLSHFSAVLEPGQVFLPVVNSGAKAQTLTIPRFRKDDPPRQALLAANGDLLRGEIEAVTNTQFGFRVGLEELHVPRDRVKAVVALRKPVEGTPSAPPEEDAIHKALDRAQTQQYWYTRANLRTLISVLEREARELKFKLPGVADSEYRQYHFEAPTIGENLDGICEAFGLRYAVEDGVVVIEEPISTLPKGTVRTVYWLKRGAFGGKDPAETVLKSKGIAFPKGCSAQWQEGSQCLEVVNSPDNQAKTVEVLNRDFGGVLGAPTHWLRLTNGGHLGLTVETFGPDVVRGTHPLYGRCTVPMSQVYAIRNTPPAPTAASQAVSDWQLVYAPEPVLPEAGGEGSTLLGKAAPTFKLKMLDGGDDFDLAKEKGHVVVLDFWATWCGPCIRSLPGMIETMAKFPAGQVRFVALNQAEAPAQVKRFLETRGWKLSVAMDAGQDVARQYGVDGIPHTVIVGPDGKVAWVKTGYTEDGDAQAAAAVKKLLAPAAGAGASTADGASAAEVARK